MVNDKKNTYVCKFLWVASAVQWRLWWRGTPCTPHPQKGGEQRCHQMNRSCLAGVYLMYTDDDKRGFRIRVEYEEKVNVPKEE